MKINTQKLPLVAACIVLTAYALVAIRFVFHDGLASFASDSGNYLLMARYLSPWQEAPEAVRALWDQQYFPPLFPLLLGVSGLAYNFAAAHLFTLFFLFASIPLLHRYWLQLVPNPRAAFFLTLLFLTSPGTWLNIMGILSENLYLLLSLALLTSGFPLQKQSLATCVMSGLLLGALMLTRSIGIAMFGAWICHALMLHWQGKISRLQLVLPLLIAGALHLLNQIWQPQPAAGFYLQQIDPGAVITQLLSFSDIWHTAWQFYWTDALLLPRILVSLLGLMSLAGLILRLKAGALDGWYVLFYLLILLVWPYPGQGLRFLYPVQPLLLGHAWYALQSAGLRWWPARNLQAGMIFLLLMAAITVPAQFFVLNRYQAGKVSGFEHQYEFYNQPQLPDAIAAASIQQALFADMEQIRQSTPPDALVAWFEPVYIALLADRQSRSIAEYIDTNTQTINGDLPGFIYLSRYHPRYTTSEYDGLVLQAIFEDSTEVRWMHRLPDNSTVSMLLEIR